MPVFFDKPADVGVWQDGEHTLAVDEFLTIRQPKQVVIVGGGYIGFEMAEALRTRGVEVTIVEMAPSVMTTIDPDLVARVLETWWHF